MNKELDIKLFKLFTHHKCDNYELYSNLRTIVEGLLKDERGGGDLEYYKVLCRLHTSENNANWEKRHSDRIQFLWDEMSRIEDRSGEYLP